MGHPIVTRDMFAAARAQQRGWASERDMRSVEASALPHSSSAYSHVNPAGVLVRQTRPTGRTQSHWRTTLADFHAATRGSYL